MTPFKSQNLQTNRLNENKNSIPLCLGYTSDRLVDPTDPLKWVDKPKCSKMSECIKCNTLLRILNLNILLFVK